MKSKKIIAFVCALVMAGTGVPFNYGYNYNENSIVSVKAGGYGDYQGNQVVSGDFSYNLNENGEAVILGYRGDKSEVTTAEIKETDKPVTTSMLNADKTSAVSLGSVSGKVGDTVIVPLCIMNNPGIISIQADISFDLTALKLKEVKKNGEFWASADIMSSRDLTAQPYRITCSDVLAKSDFTEDGTLCEISFEIIKEGTHKVELNISDAKNYDLAKVKLESVSGLVGTSSEAVTTTSVPVTDAPVTTVSTNITEASVTTAGPVKPAETTAVTPAVTEAPMTTAGPVKPAETTAVTTAEIKETDKPITTSMLNSDKTSAVSLGSVSGKVGDTVIVPLSIMNNPGIISIQADISFDLTALKLKEVKKNGEFWASADIMSSRDLTAQPYRITCSDVLAKSDFTEDGTLCEISFEIIKEGTHKVELNISDAKNYDLAKVKLESVSGLVGTSSETVTTTPVSVTETLATTPVSATETLVTTPVSVAETLATTPVSATETLATTPVSATETLATTPVSATETLVTTLVSVAETSVTTTPVSVTEAPVSTTAVSTTEKNDNPPSENIKSGKLSETITWKLDDNGTLVISGSGDIPDYKIMESPFYELDDIKNVVFEEGITGIGDCLFYENKYIRNITLSNTIEKIGFMAFDYCKGIESVEFPNSIRIIGGSAFLGCDSLERISLNEGIERIDGLAFAFCPKIKYVIIPDSIKTLGSYVFSHCDGLEMISVPETLGEVTNLPDNTVVKVRKPGELPETGTVNGDADGNGVVNTADIIYVAQAIISGAFSADINGDGVTDAKDYAEIRRLFLK